MQVGPGFEAGLGVGFMAFYGNSQNKMRTRMDFKKKCGRHFFSVNMFFWFAEFFPENFRTGWPGIEVRVNRFYGVLRKWPQKHTYQYELQDVVDFFP